MASVRGPARRAADTPTRASAIREIMALAANVPDVIHLEVGNRMRGPQGSSPQRVRCRQ